MIIHGWKFEKKVDCSKRPSEKEKKKRKWSWTKEKKMKKQKEKRKKKKEKKWNEERKEVEVQVELYCVNLVELVLFEKKNCAPLVFKNYFVLYISFLHS